MNIRFFRRNHFIILILLAFASQAQESFEIKGVDDELKKNISSYLMPAQAICESSKETFLKVLQTVPEKTIQAVQPFGYYHTKVSISQPVLKKDCWTAVVDIEIGTQIQLTKKRLILTGEGAQTEPFQALKAQFDAHLGETLNHSKYESFKSKFAELTSGLAYLDAKFIENKIDVFPDKNSAEVLLRLYTGRRYKVAQVEIIQEPVFLKKEFIKKLIPLKTNEHFNTKQLFEIKKKLTSTSYFETVSVAIDFDSKKDGQVNIKVQLSPADRIKYSTGLGFSTDTGARISFDFDHYRISEYGYQLQSQLNLSEVISEFSTSMKLPSKSKPALKWYQLETGYKRERSESVKSDTSKIGISQTRIHENRWQNITYLDLLQEKDLSQQPYEKSILFISGTSWSYIRADNPSRPQKGFKLQSDLKAATDSIISDVSFMQLTIGYKGISPIGKNRFIYRSKLGSTLVDNIQELPSSYRFYTGGDNSIRGFEYQTLAPKNELGETIGGKHLFIGSLEYEHRLSSQWALAVFTDFGNSFNDNLDLKYSVGSGVRWFSPIGPVRLDLGFPINNDENSFQFHITVGPDL